MGLCGLRNSPHGGIAKKKLITSTELFASNSRKFFIDTHLDTVVTLLVDYRNITPAHFFYNIDHSFDLMMIAGYCARKVLETLFIGELRTR